MHHTHPPTHTHPHTHTHTYTHIHTVTRGRELIDRMLLSLKYSGSALYTVTQLVAALRYKPRGRGFNPSGRTMTLGSSEPLKEMSTRNIFFFVGRGKRGRCVGLTTLPPSCADCLEILGASSSWSPKSLSRFI